MNYLGVDTSADYLTVIARKGERTASRFLRDCARTHSVVLMDEIDSVLKELRLKPSDCDFFAAVVGPGSFTGIRIGISTVKGLCLATEKPALKVTSFDTLAYADREEKLLAVVDAGHGFYYAAGYENLNVTIPPAYLDGETIDGYLNKGYRKIDQSTVDPVKGFFGAVDANLKNVQPAQSLGALYLRKSSAEENLKRQGGENVRA